MAFFGVPVMAEIDWPPGVLALAGTPPGHASNAAASCRVLAGLPRQL